MTIKYQTHEFKGTAGEWSVSYVKDGHPENDYFVEWWYIKSGDSNVAEVMDGDDADAQLIAAAPTSYRR